MATCCDKIIPAIVVVAYNRSDSLKRMLRALSQAIFDAYLNVTLIISIDFGGSQEVVRVAEDFDWIHGDKELIVHSKKLGLKHHIIRCGDLTERYGAVIILEDDLFVSPVFYKFAVKALEFYHGDTSVCGISLYAYDFNENLEISFCPLYDGYDNIFIQTASSWGQLWTFKQWCSFKSWLKKNKNKMLSISDPLPSKLLEWPETSWKKKFIHYMVEENKYFVFPRVSLTTNFGDRGENHSGTSNFQVNLLVDDKPFRFASLQCSKSIYDCFFEISPQSLKSLNPSLVDIEFDCDFYGTKGRSSLKSKYALTIRNGGEARQSYALSLMPCELNVAYNVYGDFFNLSLVKDLGEISYPKQLLQLRHMHKNLGWQRYQKLWSYALLKRFNKNNRFF